MGLIYSIAKSIVERRQAKKEKAAKKQAEIIVNYQARKAFIKDVFIKKFIQEAIEGFQKSSSPKFSVGQKVITNWYSSGDTWEGYVTSLQNHTPFRGPTVVKITEVNADSLFLEECLDNFQTNGKFDDLLLIEDNYLDFCEIANKELQDRVKRAPSSTVPYVTWSYKIKIPKDETEYWRYCWSERKLLPLDSAAALLSQKAWRKDEKVRKNNEKRKDAQKELEEVLIELTKQNVC
jgi:hypothetical protein